MECRLQQNTYIYSKCRLQQNTYIYSKFSQIIQTQSNLKTRENIIQINSIIKKISLILCQHTGIKQFCVEVKSKYKQRCQIAS